MEIIIHDNLEGKTFEYLIGYINKFIHKDPLTKKLFGEHPRQNTVYQLLRDDNGYIIHTGKVNAKSTLQGIFVGPHLISDEDPKWEYDITVLDKSNMLDFNLTSEDLKRIELWLDTDHKDLKQSLGVLVNKENELPKPVSLQELMPSFVQNALIIEDKKSILQHGISESLTKLLNSDLELLESLDLVLKYIVDKKSMYALRTYILGCENSEALNGAIMGSLESYNETGDPSNIYKTIETCLFEIQKFT